MRISLVLFLLFINYFSYAQPGVSDVVVIDGKKYHKHVVEVGNTLYGMQRMYNVPYQDIIDANPGFDGLKVGQAILVPVIGEEEVNETTSEYKVKSKETLYGLSKKFNTTVDKLIELNPELKDGLKKGQIIIVPGEYTEVSGSEVIKETPNPFVVDTIQTGGQDGGVIVSFSDSTIQHTVLAHETMYSISKRFMVPISEIMEVNGLKSTTVKEGQVLIIPVRSERVEKVEIREVPAYDPTGSGELEFKEKATYNIALMLPLHLTYGDRYSEALSNLSAQFYMGAIMAIDSLERRGLNAKLFVYDTKNDSGTVVSLLNKSSFQSMDLVIGPLMPGNMSLVAEYCEKNRIRMVCPVSTNSALWKDNRLVYASVPSEITIMRGLAEHILKTGSGDHVVLVKPLDKKSEPLYNAFLDAFKNGSATGTKPTLSETTVESFNTQIVRGKENLFVVPTSDRSTAVKFFNQLNKSAFRAYKDDIFVYGTKDWVDYAELNDELKNRFNLRFANGNFIDYYTGPMIKMNKAFRERFKTDFSKYAVHAYDLMTYFCSNFFLNNDAPFQLMNNIELRQVSDSGGYENAHVFIVEQEEYELIKIDEIVIH